MNLNKSNRTCIQLACGLALGLLALRASAQTETESTHGSPFSLGVEAGTTGVGPVLNYTLSPRYDFSLSYSELRTGENTISGIKSHYTASADFSDFSAIANWHPTDGLFHFSAGVFIFDHQVRSSGKLTNNNSYLVAGRSYSTSQLTSLTGNSTKSSVAPYLGIGWAWPIHRSNFSITADFGVMYTGKYRTRLTATGPISADPVFLADLRREERDIARKFDFFPVIKMGVLYRF